MRGRYFYKTKLLDGTKPNTNPKTNPNPNTNRIQLFYVFIEHCPLIFSLAEIQFYYKKVTLHFQPPFAIDFSLKPLLQLQYKKQHTTCK